jgi:phosphate-selective porin
MDEIIRNISFKAYQYQISHEPTPVTLTTAWIQGATSAEAEEYWRIIFKERETKTN